MSEVAIKSLAETQRAQISDNFLKIVRYSSKNLCGLCVLCAFARNLISRRDAKTAKKSPLQQFLFLKDDLFRINHQRDAAVAEQR